MVALPDVVQSDPVVLHRRRPSDVPELLAAIESSITELSAFLRWAAGEAPSRAGLERAVAAGDAAFAAGTGFEYVLRESSTGEVVGEAGGEVGKGEVVDIGYWVRSDRTGRGYATAAARAVTSVAFDVFPDVKSVEIRMDDGNVRSRSVAIRLGFTHVGDERFDGERLSGQTGVGHIYSVARSDWGDAHSRREP